MYIQPMYIGVSKKGESMKIKAIKPYRDVYENRDVLVNDVYNTTKERAKLIVDKGFAIYEEEVVESKEEATPTPKKRRK